MAVHGVGLFENDDAIDFALELDDEPSFEALILAFDGVIKPHAVEYLDVDLGACAVAAADVLVRALARGKAVRPLRARTLAALRKALAKQPVTRKAWAIQRGRDALGRATGPHSELADQWDELSRNWRRDVAKREKTLARMYDALTLALGKKRPKSVPKAAVFNRTERHWEIEPRDGRRRSHGLLTFYRVDGTLAATATYEHGTLHGPYARYHESGEVAVRGSYTHGRDEGTSTYFRSKKPTSELAFDDVHEAIVKIECDYVRGCLRTTRWFDEKDRLVTPDGKRWPPRPTRVPAEACFNGVEGWVDGSSDEQLARHGTWRFWDRRGKPTMVIVYDHGREKHRRKR